MRLFYFILMLLVVLFFLACTDKPSASSINSVSNPTYTIDIRPLFQKHCSQCHNSNWPDKNWMDYDTAFKNRAKIKLRVESNTMPPGNQTGLTKEQRSTIVRWVDQGAKK